MFVINSWFKLFCAGGRFRSSSTLYAGFATYFLWPLLLASWYLLTMVLLSYIFLMVRLKVLMRQ